MKLAERVEKKTPEKDYKAHLGEIWNFLVIEMKILPVDFPVFIELYYLNNSLEEDKNMFHEL